MEFYGITKTRPIFESAIERLPEDRSRYHFIYSLFDKKMIREMSVRYAQIERNLGEIDRARAIYAHCAEICDPRVISCLTIFDIFYLRFTLSFGKHGKNLR